MPRMKTVLPRMRIQLHVGKGIPLEGERICVIVQRRRRLSKEFRLLAMSRTRMVFMMDTSFTLNDAGVKRLFSRCVAFGNRVVPLVSLLANTGRQLRRYRGLMGVMFVIQRLQSRDMNPETRTDTVVLIHGLWMTPLSWEHERAAHARHHAGYPGVQPARPASALRRDPSPLVNLGVREIFDHLARTIAALDTTDGAFVRRRVRPASSRRRLRLGRCLDRRRG